MKHTPLIAITLLGLVACRGTRPSSFVDDGGPLVLVKEARIPHSEPWYAQFATHGWMDVRWKEGAPWTRIEIITPQSGVRVDAITDETAHSDLRWEDRPVRVRGVLRGSEATEAAAVILEEARAYADDDYRSIPGPNSNTFMAEMVRKAPHLRTTMHHNAVGKDYASPIKLTSTPSKTGGRLDTPWIGAAIGLQEGLEVHVLGLQLGVAFWPPRICIPFLPEIGPALSATE